MYASMSQRLVNRLFRTAVEEDDSVADATDVVFASMICEAESRRYLFRNQNYRKSPYDRFKEDLDGNEDSDDDAEDKAILNEAAKLPWLTDEEFLQKYRMSRKSFNCVLNEIKSHSVFKKLEGKSCRPQTPVPNQLMVFLKYLGMEGNGASAPNQ